jgi:ABC-type nitrate/sulfonate/bicarbonate transport system permease component
VTAPLAAPPRRDAPPRDGVRRMRFRGGGYAPARIPFASAAAFAALLAAWWAASASRLAGPVALPPPGEVLAALADLAASGELARHVGASLRRLVAGGVLGGVLGALVGLLIGLSSLARAVGLPLVAALFAIPKIALLPLFIIWLGVGEASKVATIALGVFSPMAIAAFSGVDGVDRSLIRMAQSFEIPTSAIVRRIVIPGATPSLIAGTRIAAAIAIVLLTAAEMIGAQHGVGALILMSGNLMRTDQLLAGIIVLAIMGVALSALITLAERRLLRWR